MSDPAVLAACCHPVLLFCLLSCSEEVARAVGNRNFTFSLLVHSDASSPMVDWSQNSSILQVRSDCPPRQLVEFLVSDSGVMADQVSSKAASDTGSLAV